MACTKRGIRIKIPSPLVCCGKEPRRSADSNRGDVTLKTTISRKDRAAACLLVLCRRFSQIPAVISTLLRAPVTQSCDSKLLFFEFSSLSGNRWQRRPREREKRTKENGKKTRWVGGAVDVFLNWTWKSERDR